MSESGCGDTEVGAAACGVLPGADERGGGRVLLGRRRVTHLSAQEHQTFTNLRTIKYVIPRNKEMASLGYHSANEGGAGTPVSGAAGRAARPRRAISHPFSGGR